MWARFTVLRDTPIDSAIAGCVIPFSRSNTIWMRWRCWGCPFQRSAVFKRRISFLVHLTTCSSESNQIRWSVRIILRLTNAIHIRIRCFATINIRFNQLWKRYQAANVRDSNQTLAQFTSRLAKLPLAYQPGTTWEYSVSTEVLGRV